MSKDEMKNRLSMALKDPILQQGFEIICKENSELKGEASSVLDNWCKGDDPCPHLKKRDSQLAKAKDLLLRFIDLKNKPCAVGHSVNMLLYENICSEAGQFLKED